MADVQKHETRKSYGMLHCMLPVFNAIQVFNSTSDMRLHHNSRNQTQSTGCILPLCVGWGPLRTGPPLALESWEEIICDLNSQTGHPTVWEMLYLLRYKLTPFMHNEDNFPSDLINSQCKIHFFNIINTPNFRHFDNFKCLPGICLEGMQKIVRKFNQDICSLGWDSNPEPLECFLLGHKVQPLCLTKYINPTNNKTNSVAIRPKANYTDWGPPLAEEVNAKFFWLRGVAWSAQRVRTAVNLGFLDWSYYVSLK
jgi:hypothetical protein